LNPADDYLKMTLNNIGMLLHPTISLLNAGAMDSDINFKFYAEGATNRICEVIENIQIELNRIFQMLGLKQIRFCIWANKSYGIKKKSIYNAIQSIKAYENIKAPNQLITRYFTEDVPTGLVPISSLGKFLDIETPVIDSIIKLSSILCGIDFRKEGRTITGLDLENMIEKRMATEELLDLGTQQKVLVK
ncbi:MAG: NAD/NADP octopine/nopaline dehydrogenase family protein, partial [Promethearchaeota archaeon]